MNKRIKRRLKNITRRQFYKYPIHKHGIKKLIDNINNLTSLGFLNRDMTSISNQIKLIEEDIVKGDLFLDDIISITGRGIYIQGKAGDILKKLNKQ